MTELEAIKYGGTDRGYKNCQCSVCGVVAESTPDFDFYTLGFEDNTGPLLCEICFWKAIGRENDRNRENSQKVGKGRYGPTDGKRGSMS